MTDPTPDLTTASPADLPPTATESDLLDQLGDLIVETRKLRVATEAVVPSVEREAKRGFWTRILVAVMAVALVGLAVLVVQVYLLALEQDRTNQRVLCPVFSLLVGGYNPESRPAGPARDAYNTQFTLFRDAYTELRCTNGIVPPPIRR